MSDIDLAQELAELKYDMKRRFKWALVGYVILAVVVAAALYIDYRQSQDLRNAQHQIKSALCIHFRSECPK